MTTFQEIQAQAIRAVDAVMAETLRHYPLTAGRADTSRVQRDIRGVLRVGRNKDLNASGEPGASWSQRIAFGKAELHLDRLMVVSGFVIPIDIRKGDKVRATDRPDAPWFEVLSVTERMHGRIVADLGEA